MFSTILPLITLGQQSWFYREFANLKNIYISLLFRPLSPFCFFLSPCSFGGQRLHCLRPVAFAFKRWRSPLPRPEAPANQIICVGSLTIVQRTGDLRSGCWPSPFPQKEGMLVFAPPTKEDPKEQKGGPTTTTTTLLQLLLQHYYSSSEENPGFTDATWKYNH